MKRLIKWGTDCGRSGSLDGLFVLDEEEWGDWTYAQHNKIDGFVYDVLGKHSAVRITIDPNDYVVVSMDQKTLTVLVDALGPHLAGMNPMDFLRGEVAEHREDNEEAS